MRLIFLCGFLICSQIVLAQGFFKLSGTVDNPSQDMVHFTLYKDWVSEPKEYSLKLDKNNRYMVEFPLSEIAYCDISFGEHSLNLLKIEPKDEIFLSFDNENFYSTVFAYGDGAKKWLFQLQQIKQFEVERNFDIELNNAKNLEKAIYFKKIDEILDLQLSQLEENKHEFSFDFYNLQKADIIGQYKIKEVAYLINKGENPNQIEINWFEFTENIKAQSINMSRLVEALVENARISEYDGNFTLEYSGIKALDKIYGIGPIEKILANKILEQLMASDNIDVLRLIIEDYNFYTDNLNFKAIIAQNVKKKDGLRIGNKAPNFVAKNAKGKLVELSDFKGKNVILGFYDNDCFICHEDINAMKYVDGFFNRQNKKDLQFVFVNLSEFKLYKEHIQNSKPMGIHLNGFENNFIQQNFNLFILPSYLIVDKAGKILSNTIDEPRLDEGRALIEELNRLFYTK